MVLTQASNPPASAVNQSHRMCWWWCDIICLNKFRRQRLQEALVSASLLSIPDWNVISRGRSISSCPCNMFAIFPQLWYKVWHNRLIGAKPPCHPSWSAFPILWSFGSIKSAACRTDTWSAWESTTSQKVIKFGTLCASKYGSRSNTAIVHCRGFVCGFKPIPLEGCVG